MRRLGLGRKNSYKSKKENLGFGRKFQNICSHRMLRRVVAILVLVQLIISATGLGSLLATATQEAPIDLTEEIVIKEVNIFVNNGLEPSNYIVKENLPTGSPLPMDNSKVNLEIIWELEEGFTQVIPAGSFVNLELPWQVIEFDITEDNQLTIDDEVYGVWSIEAEGPLHLELCEIDSSQLKAGGTFEFTGFTKDLEQESEEVQLTFKVATKEFTVKTTTEASDDSSNPPSNSQSESPDGTPPEETVERIAPPSVDNIIVQKTINGISLQDETSSPWYDKEDIREMMTELLSFSLYKEIVGSGGETNRELVSVDVTMNQWGEIKFKNPVGEGYSPGWYVLVETFHPTETVPNIFNSEKGETVEELLFITQGGIIAKSSTGESSEVKVKPGHYWTGEYPRYMQVNFKDGCVHQCIYKPDGSTQQLTAMNFLTLANGVWERSLCADIGAHETDGAYGFDFDNRDIDPDDIAFLIAAFNIINDKYPLMCNEMCLNNIDDHGCLHGTEGKALAQIVLWNVLAKSNLPTHAVHWKHDGCKNDKNGLTLDHSLCGLGKIADGCIGAPGIASIVGRGAWFEKVTYSHDMSHKEFMEMNNLITGDRSVVFDKYAAIKDKEGERVTSVLFVRGNNIGADGNIGTSKNQQRQMILFFGDNVTFNNTYSPNSGTFEISGTKNITGISGNRLEELMKEDGFNGFEVQIDKVEDFGSTIPVDRNVSKTGAITINPRTNIGSFKIEYPLTAEDGETYHLMITEVPNTNEDSNWVYSGETYWVSFEVVDDLMGSLKVDEDTIRVKRSEDGQSGGGVTTTIDNISFTNHYDYDFGDIIIPFRKKVNNPSGVDRFNDRTFTIIAKEVSVDKDTGEITQVEDGRKGETTVSYKRNPDVTDINIPGNFEIFIPKMELSTDSISTNNIFFIVYEDQMGTGYGGWTYSKEMYLVEINGRTGAIGKVYKLEDGDNINTAKVVNAAGVGEESIIITNTFRPFIDKLSDDLKRPARLKKTVNGIGITDWFSEETYESIKELIYFNIYKLKDGQNDKVAGQAPVIGGVRLDKDGYIKFNVEPFGWGWYLIEEGYGSPEVASVPPVQVPFKGDPERIAVYVGPYGIMSNMLQGSVGTANVRYVSSPAKEAILRYADGCIAHGVKPSPLNLEEYNSGWANYDTRQPFVTEKFVTTFSDGQEHFSLCADLGANQVMGNYIFDPDNHQFTDEEIYFLIAAFDYIDQLTMEKHGGLRNDLVDGTGRGLAQILLWNVIYEVNGNAGFSEDWPHLGPVCPEVYTPGVSRIGGPVKIEGYGSWFVADISQYTKNHPNTKGITTAKELIEDMLANPQTYIEIYNNRDRVPGEEYITSAIFVIGDDPSLHPVFQQRQLVLIFDKWIAFNNVIETEFTIDFEKNTQMNAPIGQMPDFTFHSVQVEDVGSTNIVENGLQGSATINGSGKLSIHYAFYPTGVGQRITLMLSEEQETLEGWTFDGGVYWIELEVGKDTKENKMVADIVGVYYKDSIEAIGPPRLYEKETIIFNNTFFTQSTFIDITGKKALVGIDSTDKEFTIDAIQIVGLDDVTIVTGGITESIAITGAGEFTIHLAGLEVADSPYYFLVRENTAGSEEVGWVYSVREYIVEVTVTGKEDGTSVAQISQVRTVTGVTITEAEIIFTNTYSPPVEENLNISVEVDKDTIRRTSAAYESLPNKEGFNNVGREDEHFRYDVNFRSTSNVAVDEFVVDDPLENVAMGHVRLEGLWTPVVWGSTNGLFNVWYRTNMTNDNVTYSNATVRTNTHVPAAFPNTGFKLWAQNLPTDVQHYLDVASLNLREGEYITAIRYEYGGVEVGFTSMNTYRDSWNGEHRSESKGSVDLPSINKDKIVPLNPRDAKPVLANPTPVVPARGFVTEVLAPTKVAQEAGIGTVAMASMALGLDFSLIPMNNTTPQTSGTIVPLANTSWNSISGDRVDWTPNPQTHHYPQDPVLAASLREAQLRPASYLVSATSAMNSAEIVSSATARIAKYHNGTHLRDHDQDAVVTRVITTFDTGAIGYQPGDNTIESSFVDNAKIHGFDLRTSGGREALLRDVKAVQTGDTSIYIIMVMGITSLVSLIVLVLLFNTRRREIEEVHVRVNQSRITKGSKDKVKAIKKGIKTLIIILLLGAVVAPGTTAFATSAQPTDVEEEVSENITIEHRFFEGQEAGLVIPGTIVQFGRVYRLINTSEPVLESTLPRTRTYTFRIDGNLSKEDLALIEGLEDMMTLTPVEKVFQREVDKKLVIGGLPTNEVEFLTKTEEFIVAAAGQPNLQTTKALERAGVSFEIEAFEDTGLARSLPSSYKATIVFRGIETYTEVIYYLAELTYERTETIGEINQYVVTATYAPTGETGVIDSVVPGDIEDIVEVVPGDLPETEDIELLEIDDGQVPEATLEEEILQELIDGGVPLAHIGDEDVPLYGFPGMSVWALGNLIMVIIGAILAVITVVRMLVRKITDVDKVALEVRGLGSNRGQKDKDKDKGKDKKALKKEMYKTYRMSWFILVLAGAIGMAGLFVLTQNINNLMVLFDIWSIAFGVILAAAVLGAVFSFKRIRRQIRVFAR
jgi:hypothetical protein